MLAALVLAAVPVQEVHCSETLLQAPGGTFASNNPRTPGALEGRWAVLPAGGFNDYDLHTYEQDELTGEWQFRETLSPPIAGNWFGQDYDLEREPDGTLTLMVGESKWKNGGGVERGAVRVYEWDEVAGAWSQIQIFISPIPGTVRFADHFARDGEWAAIGSASSGNNVFMYRRDPGQGTWSYHSTLDGPTNGFSERTDLQGDLIVTEGDVVDAAFIYRRDGNDDWLLESLFPFQLSFPQIVGTEIINRTQVTVVIKGVNYSTGQLQVIRQDPGTGDWAVAQLLDETWFSPGQLTTAYEFWRFSASEDLLLANGPLHEGPNGELYAGRAFSFLRDPASGDWVAHEILERGVPVQYEQFGRDVVAHGTRGIVLANQNEVAWSFDLDPTDCDGNQVPDLCELKDPLRDRNADGVLDICQLVGAVYCTPANTNSTGSPARLGGLGSAVLADANLDLCADRMPPNEFGYLLASSAPGFIPNVGGSSGDLCIAGGPDFGRFTDQIQSSGALGLACTTVPLPLVPTAKGPHVLLPGETWYFQYWYRDGTTSNHTDGVEILFE